MNKGSEQESRVFTFHSSSRYCCVDVSYVLILRQITHRVFLNVLESNSLRRMVESFFTAHSTTRETQATGLPLFLQSITEQERKQKKVGNFFFFVIAPDFRASF
jgi:hypothetical protein